MGEDDGVTLLAQPVDLRAQVQPCAFAPEHVQPCVHSCSSISRGCGAEAPFTIGFPPSPPLLQIDEMRLNGSARAARKPRSEEHTSELQSIMRNSYALLRLHIHTH